MVSATRKSKIIRSDRDQNGVKMENQTLVPLNDFSTDGTIPPPGSPTTSRTETKTIAARPIAFMGGNDDFRAARMRCALACEKYNKLKEDAPLEDRINAWLR